MGDPFIITLNSEVYYLLGTASCEFVKHKGQSCPVYSPYTPTPCIGKVLLSWAVWLAWQDYHCCVGELARTSICWCERKLFQYSLIILSINAIDDPTLCSDITANVSGAVTYVARCIYPHGQGQIPVGVWKCCTHHRYVALRSLHRWIRYIASNI